MHERRLTEAEMAALHGAIESALNPGCAVEAAVFKVFRMLNPGFDAEFAAEKPKVDGRDYRIPSEQWIQIGTWLMEAGGTPDEKVSMNLAWMNWGPSSAEREAVR